MGSLQASLDRAVPAAEQRRRRGGILSWKHAEMMSRVFALAATSPWINLEFAVPVQRADEAARRLLEVMKGHRILTLFVMRPVGADSAGFLSPTKDRPTVFFDIPYHPELLKTGVYTEIENILLSCEGRCSWSRLFKAPPAEVVKQYPQYPDFVRAKRQMDPCNVFINQLPTRSSSKLPRHHRPKRRGALLERRRVEPARDNHPA